VRAVLEGVAYSLKDTFTLFGELGIPVKGVRLGGGGARGPLWREIQAAVYGHTADVLVAEEGGAFGAALLAGVGAGVWPDLEAACGAAIEVAQQIEPDAKTVERYSVGYQAYRKIYPALKGIQG
jgi:xylulokinase